MFVIIALWNRSMGHAVPTQGVWNESNCILVNHGRRFRSDWLRDGADDGTFVTSDAVPPFSIRTYLWHFTAPGASFSIPLRPLRCWSSWVWRPTSPSAIWLFNDFQSSESVAIHNVSPQNLPENLLWTSHSLREETWHTRDYWWLLSLFCWQASARSHWLRRELRWRMPKSIR